MYTALLVSFTSLLLLLLPTTNSTHDASQQPSNALLHTAQGTPKATDDVTLAKLSHALAQASGNTPESITRALSDAANDIA